MNGNDYLLVTASIESNNPNPIMADNISNNIAIGISINFEKIIPSIRKMVSEKKNDMNLNSKLNCSSKSQEGQFHGRRWENEWYSLSLKWNWVEHLGHRLLPSLSIFMLLFLYLTTTVKLQYRQCSIWGRLFVPQIEHWRYCQFERIVRKPSHLFICPVDKVHI